MIVTDESIEARPEEEGESFEWKITGDDRYIRDDESISVRDLIGFVMDEFAAIIVLIGLVLQQTGMRWRMHMTFPSRK